MGGEVVKEFLVSLGLETEGALDFDNMVGKATLAVAGLGAATFAVAGAIFAFTHKIAEQYDALGELADRTGTTAADLEELGYVAQLTDSSMAQATASIEGLTRAAGDAALGIGRSKKVFEQLGISVKDSNGNLKNTTDLLYEIGGAVKDMERGQQVAVLERLGIDRTMIKAITTDVSGLREEFKAVYDAAGLSSEDATEKANKFMDAMDRMSFVMATVGKSIAVNFMAKFTESIDTFRKLVVEMLPRIMRILLPIMSTVLTLADVFATLAFRAAQAIGTVIDWVMQIVNAMDGWALGIIAVVAAWKYLNLAFLATPVGMLISLGLALGLLIDDFMTWQEGGESLIPWGDWAEQIEMAKGIIGSLRTYLENVFMYIFGLVGALIDLFSGDFQGALISLQIAFEAFADIMKNAFGPALDYIKTQFQSAFDWILGLLDKVMGKIGGAVDFVEGAIASVSSVVSIGGPTPALAPSASYSPNSNQNVSQETNITIEGAGNPQAVGQQVASQQSRVNGDMARNLKGAVR